MESNDTGIANMSDIKRFITPHNDIGESTAKKSERKPTNQTHTFNVQNAEQTSRHRPTDPGAQIENKSWWKIVI